MFLQLPADDAVKAEILIFLVILGMALVYLARGPIIQSALPAMQTAENPDACTVVMNGCHGTRYTINDRYASIYNAIQHTGACTEELRPIDALNYTTVVVAGRCQLQVQLPAACVGRYEDAFCDAMQQVIEERYR